MESKYYAHGYLFLFLAAFSMQSCKSDSASNQASDPSIIKQYKSVGLTVTLDTLRFCFPDSQYYKIQSFNLFNHNGTNYIALFDSKENEKLNKQQHLLIYDLKDQKLITQFPINHFIENRRPYFTTAYVKNFDSIFIFTNNSLQLFDSGATNKKTISFGNSYPQVQFYTTGNPAVLVDSKLFTGVKTSATDASFTKIRQNKIIYEFDLHNDTAKLLYHFPSLYFSKYFGYHFLQGSYCYNNKGKFVFSFPADTSIYESDLNNYNVSYNGKSFFQNDDIKSITNDSVKFKFLDESNKNYYVNDMYNSIYYDTFHKRYLRIVVHKTSEKEVKKTKTRPKSVILFDEQFRIIGETLITENIDLNRLFFDGSGSIYAELVMPKPKFSICFVRLQYKESSNQLSHNN